MMDQYEVGPIAGTVTDHDGDDPRDVQVGISRFTGGRWICHSVTNDRCILTDNSNAEVVVVLSSSSRRSGMRQSPPAVFVDSSVHDEGGRGARRRIFICIAHVDGSENRGLLRRFELEMDEGAESPLSPLVEYSNGASIDVSGATANSSFSSSSSVVDHSSVPSSSSSLSERHGPLLVSYVSSRLQGIDDTGPGNKATASAGGAACVHWCSHREVAVGLAGGGILLAELESDTLSSLHTRAQAQAQGSRPASSRTNPTPVILSERILVSSVVVAASASAPGEQAQALTAPAPLQRLWTEIMGGSGAQATGASAADRSQRGYNTASAPRPGVIAGAETPTIALGSFYVDSGSGDGDSESGTGRERPRCCLVALSSSGILRLWDTGTNTNREGRRDGPVVCNDGCLVEAPVASLVRGCSLAADTARNSEELRMFDDLADACISVLVLATVGQPLTPSLKIAVALSPQKHAGWTTFVLSANARVSAGENGTVGVDIGDLSCSFLVASPPPPVDLAAQLAVDAARAVIAPAMLDLQLHACPPIDVATGMGNNGSGSRPLFLTAAWEWKCEWEGDRSIVAAAASTGAGAGGAARPVRSAVAVCDVTGQEQTHRTTDTRHQRQQQSPGSVQMVLVSSASRGSGDDGGRGALAVEDAAICDVILAAGMDSGAEAASIEAKLQTALLQRVFLPGRFQLISVAASLAHEVPESCRCRFGWEPSHRNAKNVQLFGAAPPSKIDADAHADGTSGLDSVSGLRLDAGAAEVATGGVSVAVLADAVLQTCRRWATLRTSESASSGQLLAQLQGNGARKDLFERYTAEQLQWLECLITVFLEFLEGCERRASTAEGLTRGCLQRYNAELSRADVEVPAFFCRSGDCAGDTEAPSSSLTVTVARRTCRVCCITLPICRIASTAGVTGSLGREPGGGGTLAVLLGRCASAVDRSVYVQFDSCLQQFLQERAVIHADALHQSVSRRVSEIALSIQHVYFEARGCLHDALAQVRAHADDDIARLHGLFGVDNTSFVRAVDASIRIDHATSLNCRLLLQTASKEVASAYRNARDRAVTLALLLTVDPADSQLSAAAVNTIRTELYPRTLVLMVHWALLKWLDRVRPVDIGNAGGRGVGAGGDEGGSLFEEAAELSQYHFCGSLRAGKRLVSEVRRLTLAHRLHHPLAGSFARLQSPTPAVSIYRHFCHFSALTTARDGVQGYDSASMARTLVDDCRLAGHSGLLQYLEAAGQYSALSRAASIALLATPSTLQTAVATATAAAEAATDALSTHPQVTIEDASTVVARDRLSGAVAYAQVMESVRTLTVVTTSPTASQDITACVRDVEHQLVLLISAIARPLDEEGEGQWFASLARSQTPTHRGDVRLTPTAIVMAMTATPPTAADAPELSLKYRVARICETSDALVALLASESTVCAAVAQGGSELVAHTVICALKKHTALFLRLHRAAHCYEALELAKRIRGFLACAVSGRSGTVSADGLLAGLALRASYALAQVTDESVCQSLSSPEGAMADLQTESPASVVRAQLCVEQAISWSRVFEYALECHSLDEALDAVLRLLHVEAAWPEDTAQAVRLKLALLGATNWSWRACLGALVLRACDSGSLGWLCSLGEAVASADVPADPRQGGPVDAANSLSQAITQELRSLANSITMPTVVGVDQRVVAAPWDSAGVSAEGTRTGAGTGEPLLVGGTSYSECLCVFLLSRQHFREAASVMYTQSKSAELYEYASPRPRDASNGPRAVRETSPLAAALAVSATALAVVRPAQGFVLIRHADSVMPTTVEDISALLQCALLVGAPVDVDSKGNGTYDVGPRVRTACSSVVGTDERGRKRLGAAFEDRLASALHLALHIGDHSIAAAAVSAMAMSSSATVPSKELSTQAHRAAGSRAFSPSAGGGLGRGSGGLRRQTDRLCALYDTLATFDRPATHWALHRAALEGTFESLQAPFPLIQALSCSTSEEDVAGALNDVNAFTPQSSINRSRSKVEGHISAAIRSLIAHGRLVQACQLAVALLTAWDEGSAVAHPSGRGDGRFHQFLQSHASTSTSAVPYNAIDAVLGAAAKTMEVYQNHRSRLTNATSGATAESGAGGGRVASADWKSLQLHHSQLDRMLRRHFARLLTAELKQ